MEEQAEFRDMLFRKKKKNGSWEVVDAPDMRVLVADTHAHLHLLSDPALSLARAGLHKVGFVEAITDPSEDGAVVFDKLRDWTQEAGVNMYRMFTRC